MKLCWDNLEKIRLTKRGNFKNIITGSRYHYKEKCTNCGDPYLAQKDTSEFCCTSCSVSGDRNGCSHKNMEVGPWNKGKKMCEEGREVSEETRKKLSVAGKGKKHAQEHNQKIKEALTGHKHTEEAKKKMSESKMGVSIDGGYSSNDIPKYDLYVSRLEPYEECRRQEDPNILEVRCTQCRTWFTPTTSEVRHRIKGINKNDTHRFYCSDPCKQICPIFGMKAENLMKQDAIKAGRISLKELRNEVPGWIKKRVLELDDHTCQMCGRRGKKLHVHHEIPQKRNQMLALDIENCISLCENCHKWVHTQIPGCRYHELASLGLC